MISYKSIPLDKIVLGKFQARTTVEELGLEKLKLSIQKIGLLHPVTVCERDGKYELLAGQRRFRAFEDLAKTDSKYREIPTILIPLPDDEYHAKALSYMETEVREALPEKDAINAVTFLFDRYGDATLIAEELGISENDVRKLVGISRVKKGTPKLYEWYEKHRGVKGATETAIRAYDALRQPNGSISEEKAVEFAEKTFPLLEEQKDEALKIAKSDPSAKVDEIVEESKKAPIHVTTTITYEVHEALEKYQTGANVNRAEALRRIIPDWLRGKGYM